MIAKQRTQTVTDTNLRREGEVNSSKNGQTVTNLPDIKDPAEFTETRVEEEGSR